MTDSISPMWVLGVVLAVCGFLIIYILNGVAGTIKTLVSTVTDQGQKIRALEVAAADAKSLMTTVSAQGLEIQALKVTVEGQKTEVDKLRDKSHDYAGQLTVLYNDYKDALRARNKLRESEEKAA